MANLLELRQCSVTNNISALLFFLCRNKLSMQKSNSNINVAARFSRSGIGSSFLV